MKSQLQKTSPQALRAPSPALQFAAMGLAAAVLVAWPGRSHAHDMRQGHAQAAYAGGHEGMARAQRVDWHGGASVGMHAAGPGYHAAGPAYHVAGPGYHGGYNAGWHGGGGGRWDHGWHGGHYGWWYIDAGIWTAYPYYPYGYYGPYGYPYYSYPAPYGYAAPEAPAVYNNLPAQQQTWYFCDAARAYYPSVQTCPAGWRPVTAAPAPPPAPAPGPDAPR